RLPERIGFVPEDRHRDALVLDFMLHENVALADAESARGVTPWRALRERTARLLSSHDIRAGDVRLPARALPGADQQSLVLVPEDRHRDAIGLDFMLHEIVALAEAGAARGVTPWRAMRERTARLLSAHGVRAGDVRLPARALSGGNQQKLVLARELDGDAPAL